MEDAGNTDQVHEDQQGIPVENLVGIFSHLASRRGVMGALMGALAGSAPFLMARPAQAAPADLKGSPNIAVKMYQNKSGYFTLCSDGRIWNLTTGAEAIAGLSQYTVVAGSQFKTLKPTQGRIKGSPNIAVDAFVDKSGTYVLFADGSVRRPNGAAGKEGGTGPLRMEWNLGIGATGTADGFYKSDGFSFVMNRGPFYIEWKPEFSMPPVVLGLGPMPGGTMKTVNLFPSETGQCGIPPEMVNFIALGLA